jgi:Asp-tRNA(Asn)/Glu-tRNA(Gln) amidotransferase A subunit family amidase
MPIGVQLIGKRWQEAMLLQFGHAFQSVTDWHRRKPSDLH